MKACPNPNCSHEEMPRVQTTNAHDRAICCPCCRMRGPWANVSFSWQANNVEAERLWDALPRQEDVDKLRALLRDWDAKCKGHCDTEAIAAQVAEVLDV